MTRGTQEGTGGTTTIGGPARGAVAHGLRTGGLALMALGALRQSYRVRRALAEARPPDPGTLPSPAPSVSIILPLRDEAAHVDAVVASLLAQDYPAFDVTVIADGSTDATSELLAAWARRAPARPAPRHAAR